jgi:hypothetical protein
VSAQSTEVQQQVSSMPTRKWQAGVGTGALGIIAVWIIESATGTPVPSMVALAIDTVLVAIVQYAIRDRLQ